MSLFQGLSNDCMKDDVNAEILQLNNKNLHDHSTPKWKHLSVPDGQKGNGLIVLMSFGLQQKPRECWLNVFWRSLILYSGNFEILL